MDWSAFFKVLTFCVLYGSAIVAVSTFLFALVDEDAYGKTFRNLMLAAALSVVVFVLSASTIAGMGWGSQ